MSNSTFSGCSNFGLVLASPPVYLIITCETKGLFMPYFDLAMSNTLIPKYECPDKDVV